ncbi:MAG: Superoxide dismutase [Fe] [Chlamydiales bacterium]|nr:Superoxide dismutase [Fe] [Chlamydiales bacterium]MCH9620254.1 Superoxide dismutase [Fe] [Chlamydiales bacterium]MCH9622836.1 Superoxide dismutase [Fe] [Chlamydiales bacterium]
MKNFLLLLLIPLFLGATPQLKPFKAKDYSYLIGMPGFDQKPLEMHFKLYQGYVATTNKLLAILKEMREKGEVSTPCFTDIKRRLMWEYDGMRLHEDYFDNLGGNGTQLDPNSPLYQAIVAEFGSYDEWLKDFKATGAMRGIGWAVLVRDPVSGRLINVWINEHDRGHLAGGDPILIMDVFEHAYMIQFGLDRKKYIDTFMNNVNWPIVEGRF